MIHEIWMEIYGVGIFAISPVIEQQLSSSSVAVAHGKVQRRAPIRLAMRARKHASTRAQSRHNKGTTGFITAKKKVNV